MRTARRWLAICALLLGAPWAAGQELPGTPSGQLPPPLRNPYEEGVGKAAPEPPAPQIQIIPIPVRRERPRLLLVPDLRFASGYSDNIFITPDVLGFRPVGDGLVSIAPRLRALYRVTRDVGVVGDYNLNYTQFFSHGDSVQNAGTLFVGYRPTLATHAELGIRGGTAHVSEFSESNSEEGHVFAAGTVPLTPFASFGLSGSVGVREFPDRTRQQSRALSIGIGPIVVPLPGSTTTVEKGEQDVLTDVAAGLSINYAATGALRAAYDFLDDHADFSELRFRSHRLSFAGVNVWRTWLSTQIAYAVGFRRFTETPADGSARRRDTLQDLSVGFLLSPRYLADFWFTRSATIRIDYDLLLDRANLASADIDRNFVSVALEVGFLPLTPGQLGRLLLPGWYEQRQSISPTAVP